MDDGRTGPVVVVAGVAGNLGFRIVTALTAKGTSVRARKLLRVGGIRRLRAVIAIAHALTPKSDAPFPAWQGMQYLRDMATGRGKLHDLDNARYGKIDWTRAANVLSPTL